MAGCHVNYVQSILYLDTKVSRYILRRVFSICIWDKFVAMYLYLKYIFDVSYPALATYTDW